jgi:dihydroorotate dehydrogenase
MINYDKIKPYLFKLDPEDAHHLAECVLRLPNICQIPFNPFLKSHFITNDVLKQELFGCTFLNPIGLGAGFDKNATMIRGIRTLGLGFTEIGTVTPKPQDGHPKPRMFRHIEEESIQNAMGFNNDGAFKVINRLKLRYPYETPIGINIGKNKITPEDKAIEDYISLIKTFDRWGDYFVINISSPNTPGLRDLQNEKFIKDVFSMAKSITNKPILLKIAPDMDEKTAITLCKTAVESGASGIVATNTTQDYSLLDNAKDFGGVSGKVMSDKSYNLFKAIGKELYDKTILISVGGISDAQDAYRRIKAGASLIQILSGFIFKGPSMCKDINEGIMKLLKEDGYKHISEASGADFK